VGRISYDLVPMGHPTTFTALQQTICCGFSAFACSVTLQLQQLKHTYMTQTALSTGFDFLRGLTCFGLLQCHSGVDLSTLPYITASTWYTLL